MKKITLLLLTLIVFPAVGQVRLPAIVSDGMILQRDAPLKIWGWASPGEKVTVQFDQKKYTAKTGNDGKWRVKLPAMPADGASHTLTVKGKNTLTVNDVLLGDVWFCSGQSNMVHQMDLHDVTYARDIAEANFPHIRQFWVPNTTNLVAPAEDLPSGKWVPAIGDQVRPFSAVAYFFARALYEKYRVPTGIINASWGGTPIEAWISEEGLKSFDDIQPVLLKNKDTAYVNQTNRLAAEANRPRPSQDLGLQSSPRWFEATYRPKGWKPINIPGYWEDQGIRNLDGVVWYRKEIDVPASMTGKEAGVWLGRIVDADELYINGHRAGGFTYMYPQRRYKLAQDVLKAGKNTIVVRVANYGGKGGFVPDKPYCLFAGNDTLDLKGTWYYKVGEVFEPVEGPRVQAIAVHYQPAALYNAMVHPLVDYAIKGVLWYQGESNTARPEQYDTLLPALISDWRKRWENPALPVIFAQLPGFMEYNYLPVESNWARQREATLKTLKSIPYTAMTVNIDLGEWNDVHPDNKKEVGDRMALAARKLAYGEDLVYSGPIFRSARTEGNRILLSFDHTGSGLITSDGEAPAEWAIAGADKRFRWAKARIEGNRVVVWHEDIPEPKYVRYAWADNPVNPNLYNREGLPASPFRTDD
ncbi:sialate O-acetylesterase [Leadbetterella sp. DM7]|uniref:sialate O-acetylesterase n=1 Tax=Leadbetterella sp. DM7 TaxID=3235085 RepID=UPI00349EF7E1